jgi:DNA repair exonuclease SbcCD ATPase subunit
LNPQADAVPDEGSVDLAAIAGELYSLDPAEFTAARDARASETRRGGDREAASEIKSWKRPPAAAWAVNLLARERRGDLARLLDLGALLREAQANLSGEDLRRLARQRHEVIAALTREASALAADRGRPISDQAARQVEKTLGAGLADAQAGEAIASGRIVRPLEQRGLGPVDLAGAVAGPVPGPAEAPGSLELHGAEPGPAGPIESSDAELTRRRAALDESRARLADAEDEVHRAATEKVEADAGLRAARRESTDAAAEVARLERQLSAAKRQADAANVRNDKAGRRLEEAQESVEAARQRVNAARDELDALEKVD